MSQILDSDQSGDVPMTREELAEVVASIICCHTKMSPAVQWEIDTVMGAIEKHVQLRMSHVWEACARTAPCILGTQDEDVAHGKGWNAAMDSIEVALAGRRRA
ncbi:hypothetical protein [Streptomyces sp. NPDC051173]|uniref:hypothetical protein n=1 Tax=Streptomyces sp. NPDC051173 TaxID=3155164 RepID=UPI00344CC2F4